MRFGLKHTLRTDLPPGRGVNRKHNPAERCDLRFGFQSARKNWNHTRLRLVWFQFFRALWAKSQITPLRRVMFALKPSPLYSAVGTAQQKNYFFEQFLEYFFEYSRTRVLFWAIFWVLFWALSWKSTFLSTFLSTQKSTLGSARPLWLCAMCNNQMTPTHQCCETNEAQPKPKHNKFVTLCQCEQALVSSHERLDFWTDKMMKGMLESYRLKHIINDFCRFCKTKIEQWNLILLEILTAVLRHEIWNLIKVVMNESSFLSTYYSNIICDSKIKIR